MEEIRYMISDAANLLRMESHVLRYWEEELDLKIPRNEMGHRCYTKENIQQFEQIRQLKEKGYQLKAIKMLIHNQNPDAPADTDPVHPDVEEMGLAAPAEEIPLEVSAPEEGTPLEQFQAMMSRIVREAIAQNNRELSREVGEQVGDRVVKEMNYLMREREEQEEERFRKLDETIRTRQQRRGRRQEKKEKRVRRKQKSKVREQYS